MEPDFIWGQVKQLRLALQSCLRCIKEKELKVEDVVLPAEMVMHLVDLLESAARDGVTLHDNFGAPHKFLVTDAAFLLRQGQHIQIALGDYINIQNAPSESSVMLSTMNPSFILRIVKTLNEVVSNNSQVVVARAFDLNKLNMSKPMFVTTLLGWLHRLTRCHALLLANLAPSQEARLKAEMELGMVKQHNEQILEAQNTTQAQILELEHVVHTLQQENQRISAAADVANGAAQARVDNLVSELDSIRAVHTSCASKLQERDAELVQLNGECKKLLGTQQEHAEQLALKNDELQKVIIERHTSNEASVEVQQMYQAFHLTRAQEHDQIAAENVQLQPTLHERNGVSNNLHSENTDLKVALKKLEVQLHTTKEELAMATINADTWKAQVDKMASRHDTELSEVRETAREEREKREAGDRLLQSAAQKIEELETELREKEQEVAELRQVPARTQHDRVQQLPISPPPSVNSQLSRKRKTPSAGADKGKAAPTWREGDHGLTLNLAAHASPLSPRRAVELEVLSEVAVRLGSENAASAIFTRASLANIIGGSIQGLIVNVTKSATELAQKHGIQRFLCPNMDHNAWSPAGPGKHGYIQVGLGRDSKHFNDDGEHCHVFVGSDKFFVYCGYYHVKRVEPLTQEEWDTLPEQVKTKYSETTRNKAQTDGLKSKSPDQIRQMYNDGDLRAPCVRLQCIQFDPAFYQELVQANDRFYTNKPRPTPANSNYKRRRVVDEETDDGNKEDVSMTLADGSGNGNASASTFCSAESISSALGARDQNVDMPAANPVTRPATPIPNPVKSTTSSPSRVVTRSAVRRQSAGASLTLRIPARTLETTDNTGGKTTDNTGDEEMDEATLSSSDDDDDMYAD